MLNFRLRSRGGFTLTELLVATALTVIIMLMFARMYSSAVGSIKQQRSLSRNDQSARTLSNRLRGDLQAMTFRQPSASYGNVRGLTPLYPGDTLTVDPQNQRGYFYYSENDPALDNDDVLQFTVMTNASPRGDVAQKNQARPYTGKAGDLGVPNEPEQDDGVDGDNMGSSRAAEVVYFLRNGNLYRRVLLFRDPLSGPVNKPGQPGGANGVPVFRPGASQQFAALDARSSFANEFDYAAFPGQLPSADGATKNLVLRFHTLDSLANNRAAENSPLGLPHFRYGFDYLGTDPVSLAAGMGTGRPREYDSDGTFIGRLTLDELTKVIDDTPSGVAPQPFQDTVNDYPAVAYPGQFLTGRNNIENPYHILTALRDTDADGSLDLFGAVPDTGVGQQISGTGARVGEDILLPHVEAFNVEVWDDLANAYVSIGGSGANRFAAANNLNAGYNTGTTHRNVFDTWHPSGNSASDLGGATGFSAVGVPPYRPVVVPVSSLLPWGAGQTFTITNNIAIQATIDNDNNPVTPLPVLYGAGMIYRCVAAPVGALTGDIRPEFPPVPGTIVQDGGITWQCVDNRAGVRGIRVTVRYRDNGNSSPRQVPANFPGPVPLTPQSRKQ